MLDRLRLWWRSLDRRPVNQEQYDAKQQWKEGPLGVKIGKADSNDRLDALESRWIRKTGKCPDCRDGKLARGPEGGCSVNCACETCGSEFSLVFGPTYVIGDRISPPGPRDLGDRKACYGLT